MANATCKLKKGLGGSRNGRSRWESTEILNKRERNPPPLGVGSSEHKEGL
jgi:hypothetical protein